MLRTLSKALAPARPPIALMCSLAAALLTCAGSFGTSPASAQDTGAGWQTGVEAPAAGAGNTTVVPRAAPETRAGDTAGLVAVQLVALLTADGQRIDQGLVWRVFQGKAGGEGKNKLVSTLRDAAPVLKLAPGDYVVNVSFGRANLTRKINLKPGPAAPATEQFVLNAGGLRVSTIAAAGAPVTAPITFDILSDRDQSDARKPIMTGVKPGLIIRLNAGIFHIVSVYGDANAIVQSDVTVEAGKLTEATLHHSAGKVTFKLVQREGGEALSDTQWAIETAEGQVVKESVGALPTHLIAPGNYRAIAKSQGNVFKSEFTVRDGEAKVVEVMMQKAAEPQP